MTNSICHLGFNLHGEKVSFALRNKHKNSLECMHSRWYNLEFTTIRYLSLHTFSISLQKFCGKKHLSLSRCHVPSLPAIFLSKGKGWAVSVHGPLCYPIYFVHIIVSFVLQTTSVGAGFDDSSIDEHTIGIRDFSRSFSFGVLVSYQQTMWKVYLLKKKHAESFLKHKFQNVDPFLSAFHLNGLSDKRASSLEHYI